MLPQKHILLGLIFAIVIFFLFPSVGILNASIIFLSSFLIDVDHYIYYVFKKKNLNLFKAYHWFKHNTRRCKTLSKEQKQKVHFGTYFLHGIETLILLFVLGNFLSPIFYFILIGFTFHMTLDLTVEIIFENKFNKISSIYTFLKSKGMIFIDDLD